VIVVDVVDLFDAGPDMSKDRLPHLFRDFETGQLASNCSPDVVLNEMLQLDRPIVFAPLPRQRLRAPKKRST